MLWIVLFRFVLVMVSGVDELLLCRICRLGEIGLLLKLKVLMVSVMLWFRFL